MKLSDQQLHDLETDGFIILPDRFTQAEVEAIRSRLPRLFAEDSEANVIERHSGEVRTAMGLHLRDDLFDRPARRSFRTCAEPTLATIAVPRDVARPYLHAFRSRSSVRA